MAASGWSELPKDLIQKIFERLVISDHLGFRSVCSSWRSSTTCEESRCYLSGRFIGLIVPGETKDSETRRLLEPLQCDYTNNNSTTNINIPVALPHRQYCCGSSLGWLVLIDEYLDMELYNPITGKKFQLPSAKSLVPSESWGFDKFGRYNVDKAILSGDPCSSISLQTIVFIIYGRSRTAFCKPRDKVWTTIASNFDECIELQDAIYYNDKFYVVFNAHNPGGVVTWDIAYTDHPTLTHYAPKPRDEIFSMTRYLVESKGDIYQLKRYVKYDLEDNHYQSSDSEYGDEDGDGDGNNGNNGDEVEDDTVENNNGENNENNDDGDGNNSDNGDEVEDDTVENYNGENNENDVSDSDSDSDGDSDSDSDSDYDIKMDDSIRRYRTVRFKIFKLIRHDQYDHKDWIKVDNIGDSAFFVGYNSSFSVSASDIVDCKPNSVYFTDSKTPYELRLDAIRHDIGIFNLEDKSIQAIYPVDSKPVRPPAFWFMHNSCNKLSS